MYSAYAGHYAEARIVQQRGAARDRYRQQCAIAVATSAVSTATTSATPTAAAASAAFAAVRRCHPSREVRARYKLDRPHLGAHLQG